MLPFLKKHIPGNPRIVVEYLPGDGSRKAANHVFQSAAADGLIGNLVLPPKTAKEHVQDFQAAFRKTYQNPKFHKEYKKFTVDEPTPLLPENHEKLFMKFPRSQR
jgi:hypothetical protein